MAISYDNYDYQPLNFKDVPSYNIDVIDKLKTHQCENEFPNLKTEIEICGKIWHYHFIFFGL